MSNFTTTGAKILDKNSSTVKPKKKLKQGGILMALLPLAACGGGGGSAPSGNKPTPPPAPEPTFTENPTNVFVAIDDSDSTLSEGGNAANLTVTGKAGADSITTGTGADTIDGAAGNDTILSNAGNDAIRGGTGNDTINAGSGNDHIRGGEGQDNITAGGGNDAIVVVGTTTAGQYTNSDITNPAGSGTNPNLSDIITLADLNGRAVSEVTPGEIIDGGAGTNTLFIYGTVDLTGVTLTNVTVLVVNSDVTLTAKQMEKFTTVDGDGASVINIEVPPGDTYVIDLSTLNLTDIGNLNIEGDVTFIVDDETDLNEIGMINTDNSAEVKIEVNGNGAATTVNLGDIAAKFDNEVDTLELAPDVTLKIDDAADITNLGLDEIAGEGDIDTGGNSDIDDALDGNVEVAKPTISINDISVIEASESATFTITLSKTYHIDVTVDYTAPDSSSRTLTFSAGETEKTFTTAWTDDSIDEESQIVEVTLFNPTNAAISDATGQLTILDDDNASTLSISDISANEVDEIATFTVSLSAVSGKTIAIDYVAPDEAIGTLTFNPGETEKTFTTAWADDGTDEDIQVVEATLSNPSNAIISDAVGQLTILDDDAAPAISIDDINANEIDEIDTFTVSLSAVSAKTITVDYVAPDGTTGTLSFDPGEISKTFSTVWADDDTDEANEVVEATLLNSSNATIADERGVLTIFDDDGVPAINIDDFSANEVEETASFIVSLSSTSGKIITVDYKAPDGTTGTLTFNPGETEKTFITVWSDDNLDEANEVLNVALSNPTNATVAAASAQFTIIDDDNAPTVSINDISANEADEVATFTVSLSAVSGKLVTVDYAAADGMTGTITFNPGETTKTFNTAWSDDGIDEANETVIATLSAPSNATIVDGSGTLTIIDDDEPPISDNLFTAILAIDAANRGYFRALELPGNQIGRATILDNSSVLSASDVNASFFAQAYSYDGGVTISYRGTDDNAADEVTGWPLGRGDGNSVQGLMALDFYQYIYDNVSTNIGLTGNSMGGGLAGFVGSIKSQDAVIFNSMAYYQGAIDYLDLQLPDQSVVSGYRVSDEWLEFEQGAPDLVGVEIDHGNTLTGTELHDLSVLVIALYMSEQNITGSWRVAEQYFWPVLYDDSSNFANRTGATHNSLDGFFQDSGYYASILKTVIAYSTINEGTRVFGDTAIRSFYNDANDLGAAINASGVGSKIEEFAQDISYTFAQMAGRLGVNKILQSDEQGALALKGVLTYSAAEQNNTLTIELSDAHWDLLTGVTNHRADLARQELISEIIGTNSDALDQADYLWNDNSYNAFDSVVFNVEGNSSSIITDKSDADSDANYFVGGDTSNEVVGSSSSDMIHTELGNDFIIASAASDAISGDGGLDTIDYSLMELPVTVEISPDASFDFIVKNGAADIDGLNSIETIIGTDGNSDTVNIDQSDILSLTNPEEGIYLLDLLNDGSSQIYRFEGFEAFNTDIL